MERHALQNAGDLTYVEYMKKILLVIAFISMISCSSISAIKTDGFELLPLARQSGLSGLTFEKKIGKDQLIFWSHTDRGPNGEAREDPESGIVKRPFLKPGFQPHLVQFSVDRRTRSVKIMKQVGLTLPDGTPLTGLPNKEGDELPVNVQGEVLKRDVFGIDPESMCFDGSHLWMGEEYGPSILKFDRNGRLLRRYVPEGSYSSIASKLFQRVLPKEMLKMKVNRGFEGIACMAGKIFAILQSPLPGESTDVRILEFDPSSETVTRQLLYPLESKKADKIGDMAVLGNSLLVLEQNGNTGEEGIHKVYEINITKSELDDTGRPKKKLIKDLTKSGYNFAAKIEGLTVISEKELAVVNDNDFSVSVPVESILGISSF